MLVFMQPGEQLLVVLQVRETYCGIKGEKPDKLFLVDIGLQVQHKLVNIGNLGDVIHIFDISKHGIIRLDTGMHIQILARLEDHGKGRNRVDFIIGGNRYGSFHLDSVRCHFRTTELKAFSRVGGSTCISSTTRLMASVEAAIASKR
jgi:hypothetical protein